MKKFFNTAGPVNPEMHYYIPGRLQTDQLRILIRQQKYFVMHAPRQTGKTTAIRQFVNELNKEDQYKALYVNVEAAQAARSKVIEGMFSLMRRFKMSLSVTFGRNDKVLKFFETKQTITAISGEDLAEFLQYWSEHSDKRIVLFIDEIDSLVGDTLISVLRQLRAGYTNRPTHFPQSVCLVGVRDVRDYRIWSEEQQAIVLGWSAFNIKAESIRLEDFSRAQVRELYAQHTRETGQRFDKDAVAYAYKQTQGQPWLVNALAYEACFRDVTDRRQPITKAVLERACETLIKRRDTHLDALVERLSEPRVRAIVDAIVSGSGDESDFKTDDLQYVRDLGLISQTSVAIANPIYQEIVPRELTWARQEALNQRATWYLRKDKTLDMHKLLTAFAQFFRENSEVWLERFAYKESGPHLLLMAFLQRVINGGGTIHREYALGRGRVDLLVTWPVGGDRGTKGGAQGKGKVVERGRSGSGKEQRMVIEIKVLRSPKTEAEGLTQTGSYMRTADATEGHLVIFDRTAGKSWDEKIYQHDVKRASRVIHVWGL